MDLFHAQWQQHPEMHVYHYGVYEPSRLKQLAGRHATREDGARRAATRAGLRRPVPRRASRAVRVGAERYSIKNLEPLYGFKREIELRDADSSIVEFEKLLEMGDPGGELKELIQGYNADDCVSTEQLRDWLEERRTRPTQQFGESCRGRVKGRAEDDRGATDRPGGACARGATPGGRIASGSDEAAEDRPGALAAAPTCSTGTGARTRRLGGASTT